MNAFLYPLFIFCLIAVGCRETSEKTDLIPFEKKSLSSHQKDTVIYHRNFPSKYVDDRNVEVWLPSSYNSSSAKKYKVLYMHDGQNVLNDSSAYGNVEWGIDETLDSLIQNKKVEPTIVVAIWNNGTKRFPEYMPKVPDEYLNNPQAKSILRENFGVTELLSDRYLKFIVEELKPFIDSTYKVSTKRDDTAIMGSSMGGLISLYAISKYPEIFGAAGCISTHWPVPLIGEPYILNLAQSLPNPATHKIYFDYGTETLDAEYEPYQKRVDKILIEKGYVQEKNWITRKFEGAAHNEESWKKRAYIPLQFLLK